MESVTRTVSFDDATPEELARLFAQMGDADQARFFSAIRPIAATWPGAGWCQQSCSIVSRLDEDGVFVLDTLAGHLALSREAA